MYFVAVVASALLLAMVFMTLLYRKLLLMCVGQQHLALCHALALFVHVCVCELLLECQNTGAFSFCFACTAFPGVNSILARSKLALTQTAL